MIKKDYFLYLLSFCLLGYFFDCLTYASFKSEYKEFEFRFEKRFLFNTYHLQIINHSSKRTIEFYTSDDKNYYVLLKNGSVVALDSKIFCYIGAKGMYWVNPHQKGSIPFEIKKSIIQNAEEIVFKGVTFISRYEGNFFHPDDMREIAIIVNVTDGKITVNEGEKDRNGGHPL